jgi:hypothetical protein
MARILSAVNSFEGDLVKARLITENDVRVFPRRTFHSLSQPSQIRGYLLGDTSPSSESESSSKKLRSSVEVGLRERAVVERWNDILVLRDHKFCSLRSSFSGSNFGREKIDA